MKEKENMSNYWLSLEQWRKDPEFNAVMQKEFPSTPSAPSHEGEDGWARREFLKLMGASVALSSLGCVRRPSQKIIPYVNRPEEITPGIANYYSSSFHDGMESFSLLVKTREGRPLKVEANPDQDLHEGGLSARAQAHILNLYDPERIQGPRKNTFNKTRSNKDQSRTSYENADKDIVKALKEGGVGILTGSLSSPSLRYLVRQFSKSTKAKHFSWHPFHENDIRKSQSLCYSTKSVVPRYKIDKARMIVSVGCDFLGTHLAPVEMTRQFSKTRRPDKNMSQLIVFEGLMSLTGSNSDIRKRVLPSNYLDVLMKLAYELVINQGHGSVSSSFKETLETYGEKNLGFSEEFWSQTAKDLWKNKTKSLILAKSEGDEKEALSVQIMSNFLNSLLGNDGSIVDYENHYAGSQVESDDLNDLTEEIKRGKIKTVIIFGVNPVFLSPSFSETLKKAKLVVYQGDRVDETGQCSDYILPHPHSMEHWSDHEPVNDLYYIQQPTIRPLYQSRTFQESLLTWAQGMNIKKAPFNTKDHYEFLRTYWRWGIYEQHKLSIGKSFDRFWDDLLQKGIFDKRKKTNPKSRTFNSRSLNSVSSIKVENDGYELALYRTIGLADGTLANVSWLQEFPDPVTKICWGNYLCISNSEAKKRNLKEGQIVELKAGSVKMEIPVHIQPGQADKALGLAVGYGHSSYGGLADGVGVNAFNFVNSQNQKKQISSSFEVKNKYDKLANVQGHHSMEGRQIVVENTLNDFLKDPSSGQHKHKMFSLWKTHDYKGKKWGMAIDLNSCTGCSACVIACQSENNVPVVGKKYVLEGREMHWLRIDRYYEGVPEDPAAVFMPVLCQHCDNAPCETVCPVLATVHSDEGTNDMIYNRCVGTRYCSNNCPYKVRRFNWFNYSKENHKAPLDKALNPEVTVRSRGVMEKCTFCIHRVKEKKHQAKVEGKDLKDGDIQTACQQSCPANAIVFGDINDPESRVSRLFKEERSYSLLEELNAKPAVRFQSKVRNTNELKSKKKEHH